MINGDPELPTRSQTESAIHATKDRIHMYWKEHRRLPSATSELPSRPNKSKGSNRTTDGWGREIVWSQPDERTIRLSSLGKDGKPGGTGEDEDWQVDVVVDEENESDDAR